MVALGDLGGGPIHHPPLALTNDTNSGWTNSSCRGVVTVISPQASHVRTLGGDHGVGGMDWTLGDVG